MNNQEIISQGYLEAFITGDLSDEVRLEIESKLSDAEIWNEFLIIQKKFEYLAFEGAITPENSVRLDLLNKMVGSSTSRKSNYLVAASLVITLVSVAVAFLFYSKYTNADDKLVALAEQHQQLTNNAQQVDLKMNSMKSNLSLLIDPAFNRVVLNTSRDNLVQHAVVYFNPEKQQVYLNSASLPPLSESQQYQLWALIDGLPVDAGIFGIEKDQFQLMKSFEKVDAFAVTIEPKGGSISPSLEAMQVYGEV